jgi:2-polyprenyl-3-methyl-5-hydroxy-6-metoxy-1,4-benzoquinol methylase
VEPEAYERWRQTALGSITETRELEVVFEVAGPVTGWRLLDVGCGDGVYAIEAARRGAVVTGVDTSEAMILAAGRRAGHHGVNVELQLGDARALPFEDETFDVVVAVTVLCFVPHPLDPRLSEGLRGLATVSGETRCDPDKVNIPAHPG